MKPAVRAMTIALLFAGAVGSPLATRADDPAHACLGMTDERIAAREGALLGSRRCLGCHDGTVAPNVFASTEGVRQTGLLGKHPVGVSYLDARRRRPGRYRPPGLVDRRILLPGGKVECESCHEAPSSGRAWLVVPNDGDRLCLSCHEL